MTAIEVAVSLAKKYEGFRSRPYKCPAGVWTIGYGTTFYPNGKKVSPEDSPVSEEQAEEYLVHELNRCLIATAKYCPVLLKYEEKLGAIADFVYNLGAGRLQSSTLRRRINEENWEEAVDELMKWVRAGGKILPGLVARRRDEAQYLLMG